MLVSGAEAAEALVREAAGTKGPLGGEAALVGEAAKALVRETALVGEAAEALRLRDAGLLQQRQCPTARADSSKTTASAELPLCRAMSAITTSLSRSFRRS